MDEPKIPQFRPQHLLSSAHAQTLAAVFFPGPRCTYSATQHRVHLPDGDQIVLHDDCPGRWQPTGQIALMMHGLAGCYQSGYMRRIAAKLCERGVRVFRMDHRGCGAGGGLARLPYHAGATDDVAFAIDKIEQLAPGSALSLAGFSLSGNITLKFLGERGRDLPAIVKSAIAVCPPVDLHSSSNAMQKFSNRIYDRHFVRLLMRQVHQNQRDRDDAPGIRLHDKIRHLHDFDDQYTAPLAGYSGADEYYTRTSAKQFLPTITVPTMILASRDDPLIPVTPLESAKLSASTQLVITDRGGHLGFLARANGDSDRYWMDWRVVEWILTPWMRESN